MDDVTLAAAGLAGRLNDAARTLAGGTGPLDGQESGSLPDLAVSAAIGAFLRFRAWLGARPLACLALLVPVFGVGDRPRSLSMPLLSRNGAPFHEPINLGSRDSYCPPKPHVAESATCKPRSNRMDRDVQLGGRLLDREMHHVEFLYDPSLSAVCTTTTSQNGLECNDAL